MPRCKPPIITAELLRKKYACSWDKFARLFPDGSPQTKTAAIKAAKEVAGEFDWDWAASRLLRPDASDIYDVDEKYIAVSVASEKLWERYVDRRDAILSSSRGDIRERLVRLDDDYDRRAASLRKRLARASAEAFARAYFSPENCQ